MPAVERAGPVSARVNGNQAPGMMALNLAVDTAIAQPSQVRQTECTTLVFQKLTKS